MENILSLTHCELRENDAVKITQGEVRSLAVMNKQIDKKQPIVDTANQNVIQAAKASSSFSISISMPGHVKLGQ